MGMKVFTSPYAVERKQYRFPRCKKARIAKKWRQQDRNYRELPTAYLARGNQIIAHPAIYEKIKRLYSRRPPTG
jgi:hypothetical protein